MVLVISALSPILVNVSYAAPDPTVSVSPSTPVADPTESFTVDITVTDAPPLEAWQVKLSWDPAVLEFPSGKAAAELMIEEGPFLNATGPTEFQVGNPDLVQRFVVFGCHLKTNVTSPPSGSGILANVTFLVLVGGVTNITIVEAKLTEHEGGQVPTVLLQSAYFRTNLAFVDFDWTPVSPEVNETVTFNASACWDPDGGTINSYEWDFGDGNTTTTSSPTITHKFGSYSNTGHPVNLTVTDDEADEWYKLQPLRMWHDVVASDIWPTLTWIDTTDWFVDWSASGKYTELVFLLTAANLGTYTDTANITLYADLNATVIGDEHMINYRYPIFGSWLEDQPYLALELAPDTGSGWWPFFGVSLVGWTGGNYTLTLMVDPVPGETDTANNVFTADFLLSVTEIPSWNEGDANMDGIINILDILLIAGVFGDTPDDWIDCGWDPRADVKTNGVINILDLVKVAISFGKTDRKSVV